MTDITPGIHRNVPEQSYHAWQFASTHRLGLLDRSGAHLRYSVENMGEPTPSMKLGTAAHCAIFTPEIFRHTYAVAKACSATTAQGKPCSNTGLFTHGGAWVCGVHGKGKQPDAGGEILSPEDYETVMGMAAAVDEHPRVRAALARTPADCRELSICWEDKETGVLCKGRVDALCDEASGLILDLKTARDARPDSFERDVYAYKYHCQADFYLRGLAALGHVREFYGIVAVENEAPYGVQFFQLNAEALELGHHENNRLLKRWAECQASGKWDGYDTAINYIGVPSWAAKKALQEI